MDPSASLTIEPFVFRHSTRQIIYAPGCLARLPDIARDRAASRVAFVVDSFVINGPLEARVRELIDAKEFVTTIHGVPNREPDTDSVAACHTMLKRAEPDMIVAIGGGSTMDTAKVARILLSNPGTVAEMASFERHFQPHPSLFVCVPTTAGTGSEISEMAVISGVGSDIKLRYRSQNMSAHTALLDPELLLTAPPDVTAATGFDALTHALESFVSRSASVVTDPLALDALKRMVRWLPIAFEDSGNLNARAHCLVGSMLAGFVFNSTQLGLAHAIAAPLGAIHHVVHGVANAMALPAVTAFNEPSLGAKRAILSEVFGTESPSAGIAALRARLDLDLGLDQVVETDEEREAIAVAAMKSGNIATNPRVPELDHIRAILSAMRRPLNG